MGKKLVGVNCLDEHICQSSKKIYADGSIILTPGAKDELKNRGISIVYGPKPEPEESAPQKEAEKESSDTCNAEESVDTCEEAACSANQEEKAEQKESCEHKETADENECKEEVCNAISDAESLILAIAGMVKKEYGITDPQQMFEISSKVVEIIKENI